MTLHFTGGYWTNPGSYAENAAPTIDDDIVLGATPGNLTIDSASCVCKSIDFTGFTGAIYWLTNSKLTVNGSVILAYSVNSWYPGATLQLQNTCNLRCAQLPGLIITNSPTITLLGDVVVNKGIVCQSMAVINGSSYKLSSGYYNNICLNSDYDISGNAKICLTNGTWKGKGIISNTLELSGTIERSVVIHG